MQNSFYKYFPVLGFITIWISVIYLHQLSLFNIKDVSGDTYLILISALFSVVLGYYLATIFDKSHSDLSLLNSSIQVNIILLYKVVLVLAFFSITGGFFIIYEIGSNLGGMDIYIRRPLKVRQFIIGIQNGDNEVSQLYRIGGYLSNIGLISTVLGGILFANKGWIRLIGLVPFPAILFSQLAIVGRYQFVTGLAFFFISFLLFSFYQDKRTRTNRLIEIFTYSSVSIISVISLSYLILKLRSPLADDIVALVKETGYLYFSAGITALDNFLASDFHYLYGESSFRTVFKWLARVGLWPEERILSTYDDFVKVSASYKTNTYTFVHSLYHDFGIYGLLIISFIWGALTKITIYRVYKSFTLTNVVLASIFVFSFLISFYSFYFQGLTSIAFWIIVAYVLQYFVGNKLFIQRYSTD